MLRWTSKCLSFVLFLLILLFPDARPWLTRPLPSAKKRKEGAAPTPGTEPSAAATPPSVEKGNDSSRTSPALSPS